jgi:hypothetical protein
MEPTMLAGSNRRDEPEILWRLVRLPPRVDASRSCAEVNAILRRDPQQSSVIVRFPGGESHLLPKRQFLEGITGAYGWAINGGRPVGRLVDYTALTLPPEMGLTEASAAILERDQRIRYDDVLVRGDRDGAVYGAVSVADLLDRLPTCMLSRRGSRFAPPRPSGRARGGCGSRWSVSTPPTSTSEPSTT